MLTQHSAQGHPSSRKCNEKKKNHDFTRRGQVPHTTKCDWAPCPLPAGKEVWQFLMKSATSLAFDQHFHPKYLHKSNVNPGPQRAETPSSAHGQLHSEWPGTGSRPKTHQLENGCGPSALKTERSNKSEVKVSRERGRPSRTLWKNPDTKEHAPCDCICLTGAGRANLWRTLGTIVAWWGPPGEGHLFAQ